MYMCTYIVRMVPQFRATIVLMCSATTGLDSYEVVLIMKYRHRSKVWDHRSLMLHTHYHCPVQAAWVRFHVHGRSAPPS